jgi:integrase
MQRADLKHVAFPSGKNSIIGTPEGHFLKFKIVSQVKTKFQAAKLCKPSPTAKDQRWFISYWIYDEATGKRRRIKEYDINKVEGHRERSRFARIRVVELNHLLSEGAYMNSAEDKEEAETEKAKNQAEFIPFSKAVDLFVKHLQKKLTRERTIIEYQYVFRSFVQYCGILGTADPLLFRLDRRFIEAYLDYMTEERGITPRSRNNHLSSLKTLFSYMYNEYAPDSFGLSPLAKIAKLPVSRGRNIAFSDAQIAELTSYMAKENPAQLFLCQFMYYTLARPGEVAQLKVKNISMGRDNCIFIPAEISKNKMNRHVEITATFRNILEKNGLFESDPEHYIFSDYYRPGPNPKHPKKMARRFTEKVLKRLGYSDDYTLYSWKHTGVVKAWKAGMSQAAIQTQMGHTNTASFQVYIKSLSLLENKEFAQKMPDLPRF